MYILGLHIDGFGIFHDVAVEQLPPGLTVLAGLNESGKSTLTEFVRYVLFGPSPDDRHSQYRPLRGGRHGGRLDLELLDGQRVTVERIDGQVQVCDADGGSVPGEPSRSLLGGVGRDLFQRVFALSQEDLAGMQIVRDPEIRARLFTPAAETGEHLVPPLLEHLDREMSAITNPRDRAHEIGRCQDRLAQLRQEVGVLRCQADEFAAAEHRRLELQQQVEQRSDRMEQISRELARAEQLETARQHWVRLRQHRDAARQAAHARRFPPGGLRRFETLQQEIDDAAALADACRDNLQQTEEQLANIPIDQRLLDARPGIEQSVGERERLASALVELPLATAACEQRQEEGKRRLNELGPDWDPPRLHALDTSVDVRQQAQQFAREIAAARSAVVAATDQVERRQLQLNAAREEEAQAELQAKRLATPAECRQEIVRAGIDGIERLRPMLHDRDLLRKRDDFRRAAGEDIQVQLTGVADQLALSDGILPSSFIGTIAVIGVGAAAATAWAGAYLPALGLGLTAAALVVAMTRLRRRQTDEVAERRGKLLAWQQRLAERRQQLDREGADLQGGLESVEARLRETATTAGLPMPGNPAELDQAATQWQAKQEQLSRWSVCQQKWQAAREQVASAAAGIDRSQQQLREADQQLGQRTEAWHRWLEDWGRAGRIEPDGFALVLEAVEAARSALRFWEDARQQRTRIEDRIAYVRRQLKQVLQQCGRDDQGSSDDVALIDELSGSLDREIQSAREYRQLAGVRADFELELGRLERQLAQKQERRRRLLEAAEVDDEEAFRRAADEFDFWQRNKLAADEEEITLRTLSGSQAVGSQLEQELRRTIPADLADQQNHWLAEREQLRVELAADEKDLRVIDANLQRWAADDRLGERLQQIATLRTRLDHAVRQWSVRAICRGLLDAARATYERDRQPQIVRRAGEYLDTMTAGRYRFVRALGNADLLLEAAGLDRKQEVAWSGGTADQACLALRLGLARELAGHAEPLPVVLDDLLARIDSTKQLDTVRTLLQFAAQQQVLLFTSSNDVVRAVQQIRQQDSLRHVAVACFDIDDGVIRRQEPTEASRPQQQEVKV